MSFGKLYGAPENGRSTACRIAAKANDLDVELVNTPPGCTDAAYLKVNQLGKIPTFVGANGFVLSESIAIAVYLASQNEKTTLLGKTKQDYASILSWMSFANQEIVNNIGEWFRPLIGLSPYNKKAVEDTSKRALKSLAVFEKHLTNFTFLVGERITLADLFCAALLSRGFQFVLGKDWRQANPATARWFETVINQPAYKAVVPSPVLVEEGLKNVPPKKEEKAAPAKKEAPKEAEEEDKPAPKAKHPLESLPKPSMILDDWKRKYSNEETLPSSFSVFNVNKSKGGFFARLEASRKYLFGACSVYGESNNSIIQGAFLVRGQEAEPAFDVAPDWESYSFTKLDGSKAEDRHFVEDQWAQDKPITVDGKTYEWAEGKVFK
ncbi:conserved hypothetical protein [Uncinocarpus reesii 1704]|uniref:Elongation factor 1-gamma n=1 Tax=Uncinocarpus reesii (strain UAMH 1704) TaxID=336963 RepID=C4JP09_UNCRE|nr:uncharacterized protein UREG_03068 [Uncinocarpus reesii 1704]EEP78223.1 conserved hypothetical protein [Uncinocarpus reesii 1704]